MRELRLRCSVSLPQLAHFPNLEASSYGLGAACPPASSGVPHSRAPLETLRRLDPNGGRPPCEVLRRAEMCVTAWDANHHRAQGAHLLHSRACCACTLPQ